MIKKTKIIASALLAAVVSIGAGYAAWTDNLKVTATAKTGEMKVEFIGPEDIRVKNYVLPGVNVWGSYTEKVPFSARTLEDGSKKYATAALSKGSQSNKATFTLNGLYPGSGSIYALGFENNSTIPVTISGVEISDLTDELKDNVIAMAGFRQYSKRADGKYNFVKSDILSIIKDMYDWNDSTLMATPMLNLRYFQDELNLLLKGVTMQPGDIITLDIPEEYKDEVDKVLQAKGIEGFDVENDNCIIFGLPKSVDNDDLTQNQSYPFTITINVKQFNN